MIVCEIGGLEATALSYFRMTPFFISWDDPMKKFPISLDFLRSKRRDEDVQESII